MLRDLIYQIQDAIYRAIESVYRPNSAAASDIVIRDGVIVTEPEHDEEIDIPTPEELERQRKTAQYREHAQELCAKNKREGVWIELLLLGVQISSIKDGALDGDTFHFRLKSKQTTVTVPSWCLEVMNQDDINWQVDRKTIHRALGKYEIIPEAIYQLSPNYEP